MYPTSIYFVLEVVSLCRYFGGKVCAIWVQGPLGESLGPRAFTHKKQPESWEHHYPHALKVGHFQAGGYHYRSLIEGLYTL